MPLPERDALLAAKLDARAPGAGTVDRARLRTLLDGAPDTRLVLVAAPAGFGKTTAIAGWLGSSGLRAAWLVLDPRDDDPIRFAHGLAAAAARVAGGQAPPRGDPSRPFDPELAVSVVLDQLAAISGRRRGPADRPRPRRLPRHRRPAIHGLVAELIERLPRGAVLVIATRADPPIPFARLRARGELLEVRAEDLRFTVAEAGELLRTGAVDLDAVEVATLTERTEGWAAVLRLAAISLRGRRDHAELVRRFGATHRFVLDYVVEEVLAGLPPETQEFLLRTSILDRLTRPLCDAVTGSADGQERLEELERANLLIVPLDDERRWYRYHALFAGVLRARLGMRHPGEVAALHGRAAAWHAARGDDEQAIGHALDAEDLPVAVRMVGDASLRHLNAGELSTVRRWLDALPDGAVRRDAQLSASYAWCIVLPGEAAGVAARVEDAERALAAGQAIDPVTEAAIRTQLALIRSRLADIEGDPAEAVAQARIARDLLPAGLPPEAETTLRGDATVLLARALFAMGDVDGAADAYARPCPTSAPVPTSSPPAAPSRTSRASPSTGATRRRPSGCARTRSPFRPAMSSADASGAVWTALARARAELGQIGLAELAAERGIEVGTRAGDAQVVRSARATREIESPAHRVAAGRGRASSTGRTVPSRPCPRASWRCSGSSRSAGPTPRSRELFVTVGTVKSHVHAISGKLGAANRVEAVARGRALGLID